MKLGIFFWIGNHIFDHFLGVGLGVIVIFDLGSLQDTVLYYRQIDVLLSVET